MKIFLDTANLDAIKRWHATGIVNGVTTNPSHLAKEKVDHKKHVEDICRIVHDGVVSIEVTCEEPNDVYKQAREIAAIAQNVAVKIPCHLRYYDIIKKLTQEGIILNITLVFTALQGLFMCKLGVAYISPFIGRWNDIDVEGNQVLHELRAMKDFYGFETNILAASLRSVRDFHYALEAQADIVTLPIEVLEKATTHPLTNTGMELFLGDWRSLNIDKFP